MKNGKTLAMHLEVLNFCEDIAQLSKCLSRKVGACLMKDGVMLACGHNRVPHSTKACKECIRHKAKSGECLDICKAIHAEEDCIINFLKEHNIDLLKDCTLYVTVAPCYHCAKLITDLGIKRIICLNDYNSIYTKQLFKEAKVKMIIL